MNNYIPLNKAVGPKVICDGYQALRRKPMDGARCPIKSRKWEPLSCPVSRRLSTRKKTKHGFCGGNVLSGPLHFGHLPIHGKQDYGLLPQRG